MWFFTRKITRAIKMIMLLIFFAGTYSAYAKQTVTLPDPDQFLKEMETLGHETIQEMEKWQTEFEEEIKKTEDEIESLIILVIIWQIILLICAIGSFIVLLLILRKISIFTKTNTSLNPSPKSPKTQHMLTQISCEGCKKELTGDRGQKIQCSQCGRFNTIQEEIDERDRLNPVNESSKQKVG